VKGNLKAMRLAASKALAQARLGTDVVAVAPHSGRRDAGRCVAAGAVTYRTQTGAAVRELKTANAAHLLPPGRHSPPRH